MHCTCSTPINTPAPGAITAPGVRRFLVFFAETEEEDAFLAHVFHALNSGAVLLHAQSPDAPPMHWATGNSEIMEGIQAGATEDLE